MRTVSKQATRAGYYPLSSSSNTSQASSCFDVADNGFSDGEVTVPNDARRKRILNHLHLFPKHVDR